MNASSLPQDICIMLANLEMNLARQLELAHLAMHALIQNDAVSVGQPISVLYRKTFILCATDGILVSPRGSDRTITEDSPDRQRP